MRTETQFSYHVSDVVSCIFLSPADNAATGLHVSDDTRGADSSGLAAYCNYRESCEKEYGDMRHGNGDKMA